MVQMDSIANVEAKRRKQENEQMAPNECLDKTKLGQPISVLGIIGTNHHILCFRTMDKILLNGQLLKCSVCGRVYDESWASCPGCKSEQGEWLG